MYPSIPIYGAKRDIDAAFTRCRLRPDGAVMFGTEFELGPKRCENVYLFYLVLPFGFTGSPGIFGRVMEAVQWYHQLHIHENPTWNGNEPLKADVFSGDAMFLDAEIGDRLDISVTVWGRVRSCSLDLVRSARRNLISRVGGLANSCCWDMRLTWQLIVLRPPHPKLWVR